jgi:ribose 5-phosphate isomerase B
MIMTTKESKALLIIGSDHAGFQYKEIIKKHLGDVVDVGTFTEESCDYPVIAREVAQKLGAGDKGILICGTGQGMAMAANKIKGIRAAVCGDTFSAKATRAHNDANILCLGSRVTGIGLALEIIDVWLKTKFEGERHQRRVEMI